MPNTTDTGTNPHHTLLFTSVVPDNSIRNTPSSKTDNPSTVSDATTSDTSKQAGDKYVRTNGGLRTKLLSEASNRYVTQTCRFADGSEKQLKGSLEEKSQRFTVHINGQPVVMKPIEHIGTETVFGEDSVWQLCRLPGNSGVQMLPGALSRHDDVFTVEIEGADGSKSQKRLRAYVLPNREKFYAEGGLAAGVQDPHIGHLQTLARTGNLQSVEPFQLSQTDRQNIVARHSALASAVEAGHFEVVKFMLENGVPPYNILTPFSELGEYRGISSGPGEADKGFHYIEDRHPNMPFLRAVRNNDIKMMELLLEHGALIDQDSANAAIGSAYSFIINDPRSGAGILDHLLEKALNQGDEDQVKTLLEAGATPSRYRPLVADAIRQDKRGLVNILMEHPSFKDDLSAKYAALIEAIDKGDRDLVTLLLEKGAPVTLPDNFRLKRSYGGRPSPLEAALHAGDFDMAKMFIEGGADVNSTDSHGNTLLSRHAGDEKIVKFLLRHGADATKGGPLAAAAFAGNIEAAKLLLQANANADVPFNGYALAHAINKGNLDMVKLLVEPGRADLTLHIQYKKTALKMAETFEPKGSRKEIAEYLRSHTPQRKTAISFFLPSSKKVSAYTPKDMADSTSTPEGRLFEQPYDSGTNPLQSRESAVADLQLTDEMEESRSISSINPFSELRARRKSEQTTLTTPSITATPHALGTLIEKTHRKIWDQLDKIYATEETRNYYEMNKLAFITLLKGAQALRTGVAPNDVQVEPALMHSVISSSVAEVNPAISTINNILGTALQLVPGLSAVGTTAKFAAQQVANINFSANNQKMSMVTDLSGRNIDLLADTAARALTLLNADRLRSKAWVNEHIKSERLKRLTDAYKHRSKGESSTETGIRLLATQHALELVLQMADTKSKLFQDIAEAVKDAPFVYEQDHLKIKPMLASHCESYAADVPEDELEELIVWGERDSRVPRELLLAAVEKETNRITEEWNETQVLQEQIQKLDDRPIDAIRGPEHERDKEIDQLKETVKDLRADNRTLREKLDASETKLEATEKRLSATEKKLDDMEANYSAMQKEFDQMSAQMALLLKAIKHVEAQPGSYSNNNRPDDQDGGGGGAGSTGGKNISDSRTGNSEASSSQHAGQLTGEDLLGNSAASIVGSNRSTRAASDEENVKITKFDRAQVGRILNQILLTIAGELSAGGGKTGVERIEDRNDLSTHNQKKPIVKWITPDAQEPEVVIMKPAPINPMPGGFRFIRGTSFKRTYIPLTVEQYVSEKLTSNTDVVRRQEDPTYKLDEVLPRLLNDLGLSQHVDYEALKKTLVIPIAALQIEDATATL